jgi:GNAT superfamily N-acetyltransferase
VSADPGIVTLDDGYHDVAAGKLAAVVTYLEMRHRPEARPERSQPDLALRHVRDPDAGWYRDLHRRVGEDWVWFSRLTLDEDALDREINAPGVEVHALQCDGRDEGLLEFRFADGDCEIVFFGVTPALLGRGAGRWMMEQAIALAWARPIARLWLHTCTLDHHAALDFYIRSGFTPYRRRIEIADDPRMTGTIAQTAAPQVPRI